MYKAVFGCETISTHPTFKEACRALYNHVVKDAKNNGGMSLHVLETTVWIEGPRDPDMTSTSDKVLLHYVEKPGRATRTMSDTLNVSAAVDCDSRGVNIWMFYDFRDLSYDNGWIDKTTMEFCED